LEKGVLVSASIERDVELIEREFGRLEERSVGAKRQSLSEYEFDQCAAEARVKLGAELTGALLARAGQRFGWPIPPEHRVRVAALLGFALSRRGDEENGGDVWRRKG
jgi:hypothetical protein